MPFLSYSYNLLSYIQAAAIPNGKTETPTPTPKDIHLSLVQTVMQKYITVSMKKYKVRFTDKILNLHSTWIYIFLLIKDRTGIFKSYRCERIYLP